MATHLKNMKVSGDYYSQYMENMKNKKMFQTTNQARSTVDLRGNNSGLMRMYSDITGVYRGIKKIWTDTSGYIGSTIEVANPHCLRGNAQRKDRKRVEELLIGMLVWGKTWKHLQSDGTSPGY